MRFAHACLLDFGSALACGSLVRNDVYEWLPSYCIIFLIGFRLLLRFPFAQIFFQRCRHTVFALGGIDGRLLFFIHPAMFRA